MSKFNFLLFCMLCFFFNVSAQRQNTYFLKKDGQYVTHPDSADYIRHVIEPAQGSDLYRVKENYPDGTRKSEGLSSKIEPPLYEGLLTTYFPNGNVKETANYIKGKQTDTATNYFPDGKLFSIMLYTLPVKQDNQDSGTFKILTVKDSAGNSIVNNGNGEYIGYDEDFKEITEKGPVKNGEYDGVWTGKAKGTFLKYTENYADGKLISGESTDEQNVTYRYTEGRIQPKFKGGVNKLYNYLAGHTRYPPECYKKGIQGKAIMRFVVEKDGTLTEIKVVNFVHPDLAEEALRVMKNSPKWEPGIWRGKVVRVAYNIPISFSLR